MTIRFATEEEIAAWDELLMKNPDEGNVFASSEVAEVKAVHGWTPRYIMADSTAILALEKIIPLLGKFWYLPKGPGVTSTVELARILPELQAFAAENGVFTLKIESEIPNSSENDQAIVKLGGHKTFAVQPNASTVLLDLAPSLEVILAGLNQKGRHAIRRAERDGAIVRPVDLTVENMQTMYELLRETAEGQWRLRGYDYFANFWQEFVSHGHGQLFFAEYDGQVVAASFGLLLGTKGTYKDGASVRQRTVYGASHLLQWEMIKWMKAHGATSYDFCGAPPAASIRDESHRFYNIGRFKTSFNKEVTEYVGAYSFATKPFAYWVWKTIGERLVLRLHARRHHTEWY